MYRISVNYGELCFFLQILSCCCCFLIVWCYFFICVSWWGCTANFLGTISRSLLKNLNIFQDLVCRIAKYMSAIINVFSNHNLFIRQWPRWPLIRISGSYRFTEGGVNFIYVISLCKIFFLLEYLVVLFTFNSI